MKANGFGLIGLLITVAIIALLVWGAYSLNGASQKNQLQPVQQAKQQAEDAAEKSNLYNQNINSEIDSGPGVNYRGMQQKAIQQLK